MTRIFPAQPRLRRYTKCLLILAGCFVAFYTIEYWRGWHQWTSFRKEWEAKGENFDHPEIVAVPDELNAAKVPLMQELTDIWRDQPELFFPSRKPPTNSRGRLHHFGAVMGFKPADRSEYTSIKKCQHFNLAGGTWISSESVLPEDENAAAQEIIARFDEFAPLINEIDEMLTRPELALPVIDATDIHATHPPHARALYSAFRALNLKGRAHLRIGEQSEALTNIERSLKIGERLREERTLDFQCMQMSGATFSIGTQLIWEGLDSQAWNRDELERLQKQINEIDFAPRALSYFRQSRAWDIEQATSFLARRRHNAKLRLWHQRNQRVMKDDSRPEGSYSIFESLRPQGWRYASLTERMYNWQNAVFTDYDQQLNLDKVTFKMVLVSQSLGESPINEPGELATRLFEFAGKIGIKLKPRSRFIYGRPILGHTNAFLLESYGFNTNNSQRLASTAIALERFQLDHGNYPQSLSELVPEYLPSLPLDPWDNENLLRYTLRPAGRPALWSIGENQTDDNGLIGEDDLVWHYEIAPEDPEHPDRIPERRARPSTRMRPAKQRSR